LDYAVKEVFPVKLSHWQILIAVNSYFICLTILLNKK
jgi:hypothetical protein